MGTIRTSSARLLTAIAGLVLAVPASGQGLAQKGAAPYLPQPAVTAVVRQLPPPPAPGSAAEREDRAAYAAAASGIGSRDWQRARAQRSLNLPAYRQQLSCAFGRQLDAKLTPHLVTLLSRSAQDARRAVNAAKDKFARPRPFTTDGGEACDLMGRPGKPADPDFSYPSGHGTTAALWALVLADVTPARASDLDAFGRDTGNLRVACRVHWPSDIAASRTLAGLLHRQLSASPAYRADLAKARAEAASAPPAFFC
ncbi:phosphatase PAP2 family protein [Sandarakinorhabdus cyanobacteriorum]|nr:phosphatase PAP2 family protein [Sandarakinorhabdus cyanobacteriorum]